jgi:hypothetical protein
MLLCSSGAVIRRAVRLCSWLARGTRFARRFFRLFRLWRFAFWCFYQTVVVVVLGRCFDHNLAAGPASLAVRAVLTLRTFGTILRDIRLFACASGLLFLSLQAIRAFTVTFGLTLTVLFFLLFAGLIDLTLSFSQNSQVVFGVLGKVLCRDAVAGQLRIAVQVLKTRLFDMERQKLHDERSASRKSQVGSGDRSERIRTYNFPQGRMTDHRINLTLYSLDKIIQGDLDETIDALIADAQATLLAEMEG